MTRPPGASRFRPHPTILLMASAHMMVDGYGNIYAPLLPLAVLLFTGLYLFLLPYLAKRGGGKATH